MYMENGTGNVTFDREYLERTPAQIVAIIFLSSFPFITITGNILVIYTVLNLHKFRQKANVFVVSLAVADISVAIFVMSFSILKHFGDMEWLKFRKVCWLSVSLDVMFTSTSILHLMCMTIDRYIAICLPFKYHTIMNNRSVTALLVVCWALPAVFSFGLIFNEIHIIGIEKRIQNTKGCIFVVNIYYSVICSLVAFYVPSVFMLVCNIKIFRTVRRKGRQLCKLSQCILQQQHDKLMKREVKVARTIAIMLSCVFLCWLPFFILNIVDPFIGNSTDEITWIVLTWLGYINSTINPYLYYFLNKPSNTVRFRFLANLRTCCLKYNNTNIYVLEHVPQVKIASDSVLCNTVMKP